MDVSWDQMCSEIKKIFSQDSVDIDHVKKLLKSYSSNRKDWNKYANFEFDADRYIYCVANSIPQTSTMPIVN